MCAFHKMKSMSNDNIFSCLCAFVCVVWSDSWSDLSHNLGSPGQSSNGTERSWASCGVHCVSWQVWSPSSPSSSLLTSAIQVIIHLKLFIINFFSTLIENLNKNMNINLMWHQAPKHLVKQMIHVYWTFLYLSTNHHHPWVQSEQNQWFIEWCFQWASSLQDQSSQPCSCLCQVSGSHN